MSALALHEAPLADRGLVSQQIEPGSGYRPATRYSARPQGLTATYRDGGFE